jgi:hypothetical protein
MTTNSKIGAASPSKELRQLKEHLQDAVMLAGKYKREMGVLDQEELARLDKVANGAAYNAKDWDFRCTNGEQ